MIIVNTAQNLTYKPSIDLTNIKFSADIKNKLSFKKKKSNPKTNLRQSKSNEMKLERKNPSDKRFPIKSEISEDAKNAEPLTANFVQMYIN